MWARVIRFVEPKNRMHEDAAETKKVVERLAKRAGGFRGAYYLVNEDGGEGILMTLWEDERSLRGSEEEARRIRQELESRFAADVLTVQNLEATFEPADVMPAKSRA